MLASGPWSVSRAGPFLALHVGVQGRDRPHEPFPYRARERLLFTL